MFNRDRKWWGWGTNNHALPPQLADVARYFLAAKLDCAVDEQIEVPGLEEIRMPQPSKAVPSEFADIMTQDRYDRAVHTYGKAFRDVVRALDGDFSPAPDIVAYPKNEADIVRLLAWAAQENVAMIPFGGGSSVCGGIEADPRSREQYSAVLSLDLCCLNQLLDVDATSRTARIQAGMYGPAIEDALRPHGFTLRHYPQSFEFSTLGGWIATRAGGHFATQYTHIDDFVQSIRMVTPQGVLQTRALPGNGAGPQEDRLILGSEGVFGIITEAWMRIQDRPSFRAKCTVQYARWEQGVEACRQLAQSGLMPSNARLVENEEALFMGAGDGQHHLLLLGFESAFSSQEDKLRAAMTLCEQAGGKLGKPNIQNEGDTSHATGDAESWKQSFMQAPYLRDEIARAGFVIETFETCTTWENFATLDAAIRRAAKSATQEQCGNGMITCRFTHLYPDGPAPYYTIIAKGERGRQLAQWDAIKKAVSDALIANGATITHHHAVGKDHAPWYHQQNDPLSLAMLRAAKTVVDPQHILNPGTLL